jgi:hypothetical protein
MPTYWTITAAGVEKTLADWGLDRVTAAFASQAPDVCDLWSGAKRYDAAYLFAYKTTVVVRRERVSATGAPDTFSGGTAYFTGIVAHPTLRATGRAEGQGCSLIGPWWYLDERGFKQSYLRIVSWSPPADPVTTTEYTAHIFLNNQLNTYGNPSIDKINSGAQITEALNWALKPFVDAAAAPPFQIGTVDLAVDPPIDEVKNLTCAEVIRKMCRWSPDAVAWFDHSTSPPTFHCRRRANLTTFNIDADLLQPTDINLRPRHDLQRPYVHVQFERINTLNGQQFPETIDDIYPNPQPTAVIDQFAGLPFVVDLRGFVSNSQSVTIECPTISTSSNQWWLDHLPELKYGIAEDRIASVTIDAATVKVERESGALGALPYPRELIGIAADWINATFERVTITVKAAVVSKNGNTQPDRTLSVQLVCTNATSGTYSTNGGSSSADPIPENLARDLYDALSVLQYDGSISFQYQELGSLPRLGHKINLTNTDNANLATMDALVYRVREDVFRRTTDVEFGPPSYLNAGDLVSLFHVTRNRVVLNTPLMRVGATGSVSGGALVKNHSRGNSASMTGNHQKVVATAVPNLNASGVPDASKGRIVLDAPAKQISALGAAGDGSYIFKTAAEEGTWGQNVQFYWTRGCDPITGAARYCVVARSPWIENLPSGANPDF